MRVSKNIVISLLMVWIYSSTLGQAPSPAQVVVAEFIGTTGRKLTLVFDPDRNLYELASFNRPHYQILTNARNELELLVRDFYIQLEYPQQLDVDVGFIKLVELMPDVRGMHLRLRGRQPMTVEHTRDAIRFLTSSIVSQSEPSPEHFSETPPISNEVNEMVTSVQSSGWRPGDHIGIYVLWETGQLRADEVTVAEDISIEYQELGKVSVQNLTAGALQQHLASQLTTYLRHFSVCVYTSRSEAPLVTVLGALRRPEAQGEYAWSSDLQARKLLGSLGGLRLNASEQIALYRLVDGEYERQWIDAVLPPNQHDEPLEPSDILYVPVQRERSEIAVYGLVKRPGPQVMHDEMILSEALQAAGGTKVPISPALWLSILRQSGETLEMSYEQITGQPDLPLKHGDVIYLHTRIPQ